MKKYFSLIAGIFIFSSCMKADPVYFKWHHAAKSDVKSQRAVSYNALNFDPVPLNGYLAPFGIRQEFHKKMTAIGYENFGEEYPIDAAFCLAFMLPQEAWAGVNSDSLNFKLSGWQFMMSIFGFDLIRSESVALTIGPEWNFGNYRLKKNAAGETLKKYSNPFTAPGGRVDLQFQLGKFLIGGRAMYCYDITDSKWKRKSPNLEILPGTYNRGWNFAGYLGWEFDN